jgi:hypothetical protein
LSQKKLFSRFFEAFLAFFGEILGSETGVSKRKTTRKMKKNDEKIEKIKFA